MNDTSCIKWRGPEDKRPGCDCESSRGCKRDVADPAISHAQDRVIDAERKNLETAQPETLARGAAFLQTVKEAAVAMAQHMPDKRETHALFAALSDHTGTEHLSRAEKDRLTALERASSALQFGDYLASAADRLLSAIAAEDVARDAAVSGTHLAAMETRVDCSTKVEREIYEYRKRRRKTMANSPIA
jgi:hypothetical protein